MEKARSWQPNTYSSLSSLAFVGSSTFLGIEISSNSASPDATLELPTCSVPTKSLRGSRGSSTSDPSLLVVVRWRLWPRVSSVDCCPIDGLGLVRWRLRPMSDFAEFSLSGVGCRLLLLAIGAAFSTGFSSD